MNPMNWYALGGIACIVLIQSQSLQLVLSCLDSHDGMIVNDLSVTSWSVFALGHAKTPNESRRTNRISGSYHLDLSHAITTTHRVSNHTKKHSSPSPFQLFLQSSDSKIVFVSQPPGQEALQQETRTEKDCIRRRYVRLID